VTVTATLAANCHITTRPLSPWWSGVRSGARSDTCPLSPCGRGLG
jgi:hypothetical protein